MDYLTIMRNSIAYNRNAVRSLLLLLNGFSVSEYDVKQAQIALQRKIKKSIPVTVKHHNKTMASLCKR